MEQVNQNTQNAVTEFKILSSIVLLNSDKRKKIFSSIDESQFTNDIAKSAFIKFKDVFGKFPNADGESYLDRLAEKEKVTMLSAVQNSISVQITESQLEDTIKAFTSASNQRKLKNDIFDLSLESDITSSRIRSIVDKAEKYEATEKAQNSAEKYLAEYDKMFECISTGYEIMDNLLNGGFIKGTLATIGARPSTGKTTFAINIVSHNPDIKILMFSIEMSARMIYDRLIADVANVGYISAGKHQVRIDTVKAVLNKYHNLKIIDNVSNIEDMIDIIYAFKPDLVIIDFTQIITSSKKFVDNRQRIDYVSQVLKMTAKELNCCILSLSQVTRAGKDKPTMSDLKESGGLEQDCDYVILLHRPYVVDKSGDAEASYTIVTLDKNKFGRTKELEYDFNGEYQRFSEIGEIAKDDREKSKPIAKPKKTKKQDVEQEEISADDDLPF